MNIKQAIFGLGPKPYSDECDCGGCDPASPHFGACFGECATRQPKDGVQRMVAYFGDVRVTMGAWPVPPRQLGLVGHVKKFFGKV